MHDNVSDIKYFVDSFPEISLDDESKELFKNVKIIGANLFRKSRRLEIAVLSDRLLSAVLLSKLEHDLITLFNIDSINIKVKYDLSMPIEELLDKYRDDISLMVNKKVAISRGILFDSNWELCGKRLVIRLKNKGADVLKSHNCNYLIENIIEESFSVKVKVEFTGYETDEIIRGEYRAFKEKEEAKIPDSIIFSSDSQKTKNGKKRSKYVESGQTGDIASIILGKDFNNNILRMADITQDSGKVAVCGCILKVDFKEIRGERRICIFDMTDYTSSLTIKFFVENGNYDIFKGTIKENIFVKVRGEAQYDKFSKELTILATDIVEVAVETKVDLADTKRVELHLHTQMSSMDAVTPTRELVKRAADWGHKAVAITDHGVVQAYPDAHQAAKENKIKIIYGIECYLVDDSAPIVYNPNNQSINGEFVVLDVETTGLDAEKDKITEIGAVKIKEGKIIDRFSSFVNPEVPIPNMIVKLTGITNEMVKDSPTIEPVLLELMEFIGGTVIVAHNAPFDMGFIKHNAKIIGEKVNNPFIDTLQLCRRMFPVLEKYKLDVVAGHLGVTLDNYHRAADDSNATAQIFLKCLEILKDRGIETINDIQKIFEAGENTLKADTYHAMILVENQTGLKNLYKIVSYSHLKYFYKKPRVPKSLFTAYRDGLLLGSACEAGELYTALANNRNDDEIARIVKFYDYLEIQPLGNNRFLINNGKVKSQQDLKNLNHKIVKLGEKFKKPVVATCDVHFMEPRDEVFRRILMAGQGYEDADNQAPLFLRTTDEMLDEFSYLGEQKAYEVVVANTNMIAGRIENIIPIPEGTFPPQIKGAEDEIRRLAEGKAKEIYGEALPETVKTRLEKELDSIIKNGFSVMYIIAQKLVTKSLNDGYLVGSRGSVGSSLVANLVGITEVNSLQPHYVCNKCKHSEFIISENVECGFDLPDKSCPVCGEVLKKDGYDIPFETFLGFEGDKEPDIDLNFSGEYQPVAHKYTEELFGAGNVYRAGTIATIADKTAFGFVKNYLDERGIVVTNAEINRLVRGCMGVKKTTGQHPGGIIIVPQGKEIFEFCPIQHPADDTKSNIITTHFDYHSISGRLLKLDILGHDDPTAIKMLEDLTGVDARAIPMGEERTMGIFRGTEPLGIKSEDINSEVGTFGIPEFGTKFVRQMLVDTRPKTFAELIRISGLSHGTDVWQNNAQDIIKAKTATLSEVICIRDDIMLYLIHKGLPPKTAFKITEDVRKGKGLKEDYEREMEENMVPDWYIQSCKKIKYMFPKAHAAAYVMMAFRIAWFKVYYPEAFYITYFTVRADEFDADLMIQGQDRIKNKIREFEQKGNNMTQKEKNVLTILEVVNEMYARKIAFLPVDLYESHAEKFQNSTDGGIRPPLIALQGLGGAAAQNIAEARKNGPFLSVDDLRTRAKISKPIIEILQNHGCFKGIPESNQMELF